MTSNGQNGKIVAPPTPMKITQIAVVVRDMKSALKSYTETLRWGPCSVFEYAPPLLHDTRVRGEAVEYRMIGAETSVAGLGLELIQPVSGPRIYQELLDAGGEVLMCGRMWGSVGFYGLDPSPMLKFGLESGSGHAIDLRPTYVYP